MNKKLLITITIFSGVLLLLVISIGFINNSNNFTNDLRDFWGNIIKLVITLWTIIYIGILVFTN